MPRYAYVNGRYCHHGEATVHIEDRGYQLGDGVYEVVTILNGKMVDEAGHLDRLERSLSELRIDMPVKRDVIRMICREMVKRNGIDNGLVYMQVTRGVAPRNHAFPTKPVKPALVMTTKRMDFARMAKFTDGVEIITVPEQRWARRDIKTIGLLPNCLGKQAAVEAGAYEAWQVDDDGYVTEGTSSNAWILTKEKKLVTRQLNQDILHGITRKTVLELAVENGIEVEERAFTLQEAYEALEAYATSATSFVTPIVKIDDHVLGNGKPGSFGLKLLAAYQEYAGGKGAS
ncbi:D-amino-acid transaminase [Aestuariispira insulae]|uniref:Probable branched-chain-amino-acid aminotransferase n=1 Tax=Aestuariispira insulae TaxID=1461337 RepID=A0A3D9HUZ0_9PROT|nr:D-amino-acid transaminase [Aestuariispira insulae]RED53250.1 D-alanine transaminase [Aestuariispira insulae]